MAATRTALSFLEKQGFRVDLMIDGRILIGPPGKVRETDWLAGYVERNRADLVNELRERKSELPSTLGFDVEALEAASANLRSFGETYQRKLEEAQAEGDQGLEHAATAAGDWLDEAVEAVRKACLLNETLICDDVWATGLRSCGHDRAFGAAMRRAVQYGWMTPTGKTRPSVRSHGSQKPEYRSLLFGS